MESDTLNEARENKNDENVSIQLNGVEYLLDSSVQNVVFQYVNNSNAEISHNQQDGRVSDIIFATAIQNFGSALLRKEKTLTVKASKKQAVNDIAEYLSSVHNIVLSEPQVYKKLNNMKARIKTKRQDKSKLNDGERLVSSLMEVLDSPAQENCMPAGVVAVRPKNRKSSGVHTLQTMQVNAFETAAVDIDSCDYATPRKLRTLPAKSSDVQPISAAPTKHSETEHAEAYDQVSSDNLANAKVHSTESPAIGGCYDAIPQILLVKSTDVHPISAVPIKHSETEHAEAFDIADPSELDVIQLKKLVLLKQLELIEGAKELIEKANRFMDQL